MINYEEEMKLRHDLRVVKSARDFYIRRWEEACKIMSDNSVGPYKYTETFEQRLQRRLDNACEHIKIRTDLAVNNIITSFGEHESIRYAMCKHHTIGKRKRKWFVRVECYQNIVHNHGPFKTKKLAKEYFEKHHVWRLTSGVLFDQLKNKEK